jgi:hypothetical protein
VPLTALAGNLGLATVFAAVVLLECVVLAVNHYRCPLTDVAARYTDQRAPNFNIYLPVWLAGTTSGCSGRSSRPPYWFCSGARSGDP